MLFNSFEFLFGFVPLTLAVFFLLGVRGAPRAALAWLVLASLFFYGWWNPIYLLLIGASILLNYAIGVRLLQEPSRALLTLGVALNLGAIGYFKYAHFLAANLERTTGIELGLGPIVLPLAISFFTFQQISWLVDAHRGQVQDRGFLSYALFVTFFPQLIAGPIVHHSETIPQFARDETFRIDLANLTTGLAIFVLGLFKKVVLADGIAVHATPVFDAALAGARPTLFEAWGGALSYTFQLYYDFSGYSDMAIGLALMMNVRLPVNFDSPYKSVNVVEFWRRWHMTLSRFLRSYLYIPLGGNRHGTARRYLNLMVTMLLGGLWHGAAWTFVVWGALHGLYLIVVHLWHGLRRRLGHDLDRSTLVGRIAARALTFLVVVIAWVFFRAGSFEAAWAVLSGMAGQNGVILPPAYARLFGPLAPILVDLGWRFELVRGLLFGGVPQVLFLMLLAAITFLLPNTLEWAGYLREARWRQPLFDPARPPLFERAAALPRLRPGLVQGWLIGLAFGWTTLNLFAETPSEFLYFQF
jgi:alginate O-acetyltransferase complex protein AlgI